MNKRLILLSLLILIVISAKTVMAAEFFDLLVEPDEPTQYDKVNLFVKALLSFTANITISGISTNLTEISLTETDEYNILDEKFLAKGSYTVTVTNASNSSQSESESFSVREPVATSGTCGNRVCELSENYKNCFNDCYNIYPSSGKVCYELTGQKIYFHFGNLFNESNYTVSDDIERLGSESSYNADTKEYCVKRDGGDLSENDLFYISRNGRNWNAYIYGERNIPEDQCHTFADCDDGNECTLEYCVGAPKNCSHVPVQGCVVAACGNNNCDSNESQASCPKDCGCPVGKTLQGNSCIVQVQNCTSGFYLVDNACKSTCGDNICASDESSSNCCSDCACGEGFSCVDNACKIKETAVITEPVEPAKSKIWILAAIGVVLIASLGVLFTIMRLHKKPVPELGKYVTSMRMQGYTDEQIKAQLGRFYGQEISEKILKDNPR